MARTIKVSNILAIGAIVLMIIVALINAWTDNSIPEYVSYDRVYIEGP